MKPSTRIPKPDHFDYLKCLEVLGDNEFECLHHKSEGKITKALTHRDRPFVFRLKEAGNDLELELLSGEKTHLAAAIAYVREWFDLDRDLSPFYERLREDPDFAYLADRFAGLRLMGIPDLFEALCWSILGQQINIQFASKLKRRLVESFGDAVELEGKVYHLFPRPAAIAHLDVEQLRPFQISQRKAEYMIGVASLFAEGKLSKSQLESLKDPVAIQEALTSIRGIGLWTANYAMMKSLQLPNSIPYGDSGLNAALNNLKKTDKRPAKEVVDEIFAPFEGWKSYLTRYLWRSLSLERTD